MTEKMRHLVLIVAVATIAGCVHGQQIANYLDVVKCAGQLNYACVLDKSEDILIDKHHRFLVEADAAVAITGRKTNDEETPSVLMESISNIITEITDMFFKHGFSGFFRDAKEDKNSELADASDDETENDDDDDEEDESAISENKKEDAKSRSLRKGASEARGKKKKEKKKKIKAIIKLLILGVVFYGKITLLLKLLAAHLQFKFLAIAAAGLLINAARFYLDLKKGHHPQKVIYYEHAQHQHHYDNEDDWGGSSHGGGGYWGRAYDDEDKASAQDLAYRKQKKPEENSWF